MNQRRPGQKRSGFTLIELLVALVLAGLILELLWPFLHQLLTPHPESAPSVATWKLVLQADVAQAISPAKSAVPVVDVEPASGTNPYPRLVIQTLCRPGANSRGPLTATYTLETEPQGSDLDLVRTGQGWHDVESTRQVLATGLTDWSVDLPPPTPAEDGQEPATQPSAATQPAPAREGPMTIRLSRGDRADTFVLWLNLPAQPESELPESAKAPAADGSTTTEPAP